MGKLKIGSLISGSGTNLQAIIDSCGAHRIDGNIVFVGTDNPNATGLNRAKQHKIPFFVVDYSKIFNHYQNSHITDPPGFDVSIIMAKQKIFLSGDDLQFIKRRLTIRAIAERQLLNQINQYEFDLLILAGFMRNLTPYFIDNINPSPQTPKIMNIHPALLPSFKGVDGYGDTFKYGCKIGGCTVHFVDYGEDTGPIIGQKAFAIEPDDTLETVKQKGLQLEWQLYPECIQLFAQNRLHIVEKEYISSKGFVYKRAHVEIQE